MQQREKLLAGCLGVLVVGWFAWPVFSNTFLVPLRDRDARLTLLRGEVSAREDREVNLIRAQARIRNAKALSLPPDPLDAQRLYAEWLTDVAQMAGWSELKLSLGSRNAKGNTWTTIPVTVTGRARLRQLEFFLQHFERTQLLHRVAQLSVESTGNVGDPFLNVTLQAEGLSLPNAETRTRLFAEATLQQPLDNTSVVLVAAIRDGLPPLPMIVRAGTELLRVVAIEGEEWQVERGWAGTTPQAHEREQILEVQQTRDISLSERPLMATRWFTKPSAPMTKTPQLTVGKLEPMIRGKAWKTSLKLTNWDSAWGEPEYSVLPGGPESLQVDRSTGVVNWTPPEDAALGSITCTVQVKSSANAREPLTLTIANQVQRENRPPVIEPAEPQTVWLGRPTIISIKATDPDGAMDPLKYSLIDAKDELVTVNAVTGELTALFPRDQAPEERSVRVQVEDSGTPPLKHTLDVLLKLEDDPLRYTFLVACVVDEKQKEAWLLNRALGRKQVVKEGDETTLAGVAIKVREIATNHMICEIEGQLRTLPLGKPVETIMLMRE